MGRDKVLAALMAGMVLCAAAEADSALYREAGLWFGPFVPAAPARAPRPSAAAMGSAYPVVPDGFRYSGASTAGDSDLDVPPGLRQPGGEGYTIPDPMDQAPASAPPPAPTGRYGLPLPQPRTALADPNTGIEPPMPAPGPAPAAGSGKTRPPPPTPTGAKVLWPPLPGETTATLGSELAAPSFFSEARVGLLGHDIGAFGRTEERGLDANLELLFSSPTFLQALGAPRPHIGTSLNTDGRTNQWYAGLTWDFFLDDNFFVEGSLGGEVHDGILKNEKRRGFKELGCRGLFRGSVAVGYQLFDHYRLMATLDHASNGGICDRNEGIDTAGLKLGYQF